LDLPRFVSYRRAGIDLVMQILFVDPSQKLFQSQF